MRLHGKRQFSIKARSIKKYARIANPRKSVNNKMLVIRIGAVNVGVKLYLCHSNHR